MPTQVSCRRSGRVKLSDAKCTDVFLPCQQVEALRLLADEGLAFSKQGSGQDLSKRCLAALNAGMPEDGSADVESFYHRPRSCVGRWLQPRCAGELGCPSCVLRAEEEWERC